MAGGAGDADLRDSGAVGVGRPVPPDLDAGVVAGGAGAVPGHAAAGPVAPVARLAGVGEDGEPAAGRDVPGQRRGLEAAAAGREQGLPQRLDADDPVERQAAGAGGVEADGATGGHGALGLGVVRRGPGGVLGGVARGAGGRGRRAAGGGIGAAGAQQQGDGQGAHGERVPDRPASRTRAAGWASSSCRSGRARGGGIDEPDGPQPDEP